MWYNLLPLEDQFQLHDWKILDVCLFPSLSQLSCFFLQVPICTHIHTRVYVLNHSSWNMKWLFLHMEWLKHLHLDVLFPSKYLSWTDIFKPISCFLFETKLLRIFEFYIIIEDCPQWSHHILEIYFIKFLMKL